MSRRCCRLGLSGYCAASACRKVQEARPTASLEMRPELEGSVPLLLGPALAAAAPPMLANAGRLLVPLPLLPPAPLGRRAAAAPRLLQNWAQLACTCCTTAPARSIKLPRRSSPSL